MHKNAQKCKNANAFSRSQTIFLRKIQIVCGVWSPATPAFGMNAHPCESQVVIIYEFWCILAVMTIQNISYIPFSFVVI